MLGEPSRCKPRALVTPSCRCMSSTMWTLRSSRPSRQCQPLASTPKPSSTAGISRTSLMWPVRSEFSVLIYDFFLTFFYPKLSWINTNESERSGMAVLDVAIPTGYWIQQQKLDTYVLSNRVRNLRRARYLERKIIFYFDYVRLLGI